MSKYRRDEMEKLERLTVDYGGGSGHGHFESDLFRVVWWRKQKGMCTELELNLSDESIYFDGHVDLSNDEMCLSQIDPSEVLGMIEAQKEEAFRSGRKSKVSEVKAALMIDDYR
jgi:hypothetical protein